MKKWSAVLDRIENWGIFSCFTFTLVSLTVSILSRYVFRRPLAWPDELTTYLFILMTFLGASASVKENSELKVNALYERFPQWQFAMDLLLHSVRMAVCIIFVVAGINFVSLEYEMATYSPIIRIPVYLIFAMLPFLGVIMGLRTIECFVNLFQNRR
jgi:TRAP-type C4-dicarboxylate transport system permease small subunit